MASMVDEPPGGRDWQPPHGFSQVVTWDGEAVSKRFSADTAPRCRIEREVLAAVAGVVPVPDLVPSTDPLTLRLAWVPGCLGQEWVAATGHDRAARHRSLMADCGAVIRRLQTVAVDAAPHLPGAGAVLCHGDFAPYNLVVDERTGAIQAVIDWELAHRGDAFEDLAWMEWNMRIWYSPEPAALANLYRAYGDLAPWPERHEAMIERCRPHLERARTFGPADLRERWEAHFHTTERFEEVVSL